MPSATKAFDAPEPDCHWPPSRAEGLRRLAQFRPSMGRVYAGQRNYDEGPGQRKAVSELSPYIRHRLVTEQETVAAALADHGYDTAEKFIQEVFWRTYWKGWLEQRPAVWQRYCRSRDAALDRLAAAPGLRRAYEAAIEGRTGIDCFDVWARELVETGYLHNHTRMWFASIWIFTLSLPWELGADFFLRHLLDGDAASNTLSWRWVAGLQTTGKTYLARADNIATYTFGRRTPGLRALASQAIPLTEDPIPPPQPIAPQTQPSATTPAGLLIHEEDLAIDSLLIEVGVTVTSRYGVTLADRRSPETVSNLVRTFVTSAVSSCAPGEPSADAVVDWARSHGLAQIVTAYAPIGPVRDWLDQDLEPALQSAGLPLVRLRRAWDTVCWPHATKGFFPFKERIPGLIAQLIR